MKKLISIILCLLIVHPVHAFSDLEQTISDTATYLYETVTAPNVGAVGGEWTIIGLARSDTNIPNEYYQNYYRNVENYVKECNGVLHDRKYTEYSRVILALTAIGKNPANVAGYNLLTPLGDYENTIRQGINGPVWALIALDSGNYEIPTNKNVSVQATRDMYIERILDCQLADGGWALSSKSIESDPDITGMTLQALSKYQYKEKVKIATEKALTCMSQRQDETGGFQNQGTASSESSVQMLVALCELGIPITDSGFCKNGHTIFDSIMEYSNNGGFLHHPDDTESNLMATEQAFYGLVSLKRINDGKSSLYRMTEPIKKDNIFKTHLKDIFLYFISGVNLFEKE